MKNARRLMLNTVILTASSLCLQTVGVMFNVYLTNRIGSAGIGLFQLVMTVYSLAVTLAGAGVRLASTRMTVDAVTLEGQGSPRDVMRVCLLWCLAVSGAVAALLTVFSEPIARGWLSDVRCATSLRMLGICLPFVSMSSALSGYFTSVRCVVRYSVVQGAEQVVKIAVVAAILGKMLARGEEYASVAIVIGMCVSEIFSFLCLWLLFRFGERKRKPERVGGLFARLRHIAVPDAAGASARSVLLTIEHLLIPKGFKKSGCDTAGALSIYGAIHGMALPILLYPASFLSSLSGLLVPEIAECAAMGKSLKIDAVVTRVLRVTLMFAMPVAAVMYAFADGLSQCVYESGEATQYLRVLAPLLPVMYTDTVVDGMLKGLDQQLYTMRYNIIDSALCVVMVWFLLPVFAVKGYIFVLFASEIINFYLSMRRLIGQCRVEFSPVRDLLAPFACALAAAAAVGLLRTSALGGLSIVTLTALIAAVLLLYYASMRLFGCVSAEDIRWFKGIFR